MFSPQTTFLKETPVKLLTGYCLLQIRFIMTLCTSWLLPRKAFLKQILAKKQPRLHLGLNMKHSHKSRIKTKEALLRFTVLGTLFWTGVQGAWYASIKIAIFRTLRRTRALRTLFVYTEFMKKKVFELLTLAAASPARRRSWVETLVMLRAKFHVVSSFLSVLKIAILMLAYHVLSSPVQNESAQNRNNDKS